MKTLMILVATLMSLPLQAGKLPLPNYNWDLTDLAENNISKETLYQSMNRDFVKLGQSICANRAHLWTYDFKRHHDVDAGKIFLFYTGKTGRVGRTTWWYHVSPVVAENKEIWVMDAGFPGSFNEPLKVNNWLEKFVGSHQCKLITPDDKELIEKMFQGQVFPEYSKEGKFDCYYILTPGGYAYPGSVAMNLLGEDGSGRPVHFERDELDLNEVYSACVEASTTSIGGFFGGGKKKCRKYLDL